MFARWPADLAAQPSHHLRAACVAFVLADTAQAAPVPTVSAGAGGEVLLGTSPVTLSVTFDNSASPSSGNVGYGPFIDLYFPVNGADGGAGSSLPPDGVDYVLGSARFLGVTVTEVVQLFPPGPLGGSGCVASKSAVAHPLARDAATNPVPVCGTPGDKLVTLRLPTTSFTPQQPPATITFEASLSGLADQLVPLAVRAQGGFWLGSDPNAGISIYDPAGFTASAQVTPKVLGLAVSPSGTEGKGTTGPGFPTTDTVTLTVGPGQTVTNLKLSAYLDDNVVVTGISAPGAGSVTVGGVPPSFPLGPVIADGTANRLVVSYPGVTGSVAVDIASFTPLVDAGGSMVMDATSGAGSSSELRVNAVGDWQPLDPRDPAGSNNALAGDSSCPSCPPTATRSLLVLPVRKSVTNLTDGSNSPGDVLQTTVTIQLSDFFAVDNVKLFDRISDGQHVTGNPQIAYTQHGVTQGGAVSNFQVREYFTGGTPGVGGLPDPQVTATAGDTVLVVDLSAELALKGFNEFLGGCVPAGGTGVGFPDCNIFNQGATKATLTYQTTVQDSFTDEFPSGDASVDLGDQLHDQVLLNANTVLNTTNLAPTGATSAVADDSTAVVALATGALSTTLYAITHAGTGVTTLNPPGVPQVQTGDVLTFRLRAPLPSADFEDLQLWDFLPLPSLSASQIASFDDTISDGTGASGTGIPAAGHAMWGPTGVIDGAVHFRNRLTTLGLTLENGTTTPTVTTPGGMLPAACGGVAIAASENALSFCFGDVDDPGNGPSAIDILLSVTFLGDVSAQGSRLINRARLEAGATNGPGQTVEDLVEFSVALTADLSISVTDGVTTAVPGGSVTYTVVAANAGPDPVAGATVDDTFPATLTCNWTCAGASGGACTAAGAGDINDPVTLPAGGSVAYTASCSISAAATGTLANTATVNGVATDPTPGNNSATDTDTLAAQADVAITKTVDNPSPTVGSSVTFTLTASNTGPSAATGVQVTDLLPAGLTYVSDTGAGSYLPGTGVWTVGPLASAGSVSLQIVASVTRSGSIVNHAAKTAQGEADPDPSNNTAVVGLNAPAQADVQVNKTVDNATPVLGTNVVFTVTARNAGASDATGVVLTDLLPVGLAYVSDTGAGAYVPGTGVWAIGPLANGATATLQIVAMVSSLAAITNTATKTSAAESDFNTTNDASSVTLNGGALADLALGKTASQEPVSAGTSFVYTIVVVNNGPATATGVTVTDDLTAVGVTLDLATASQGSCSGNPVVSCSLGVIEVGGGATITLLVTKTAGGSILNAAAVTADETDPNPANNSNGEATTPVVLMEFVVE